MKIKTVFIAALAALFVGGAIVSCKKSPPPPAPAASKKLYQCSMHPNIVQDHPGRCPICGMDLTPVAETKGAAIPGRAAVELSQQQEQLIGLRIAPARKLAATKTIRAPSRVEYVEGKLAHVSFRTRGWVEKVHADFTGAWVKAGDPLLDIYSPDLLVAQREYVSALQLNDETLIAAAKSKLKLLDVSDDQIAALAQSRQPTATVTLRAPIGGYIEHKSLWLKKLVNPDEDHIDIVDLSTVWVIADLYADEFPLAQVGQEAAVSLVAAPDKKFSGKVSYVYPTLDDKTRTGRIRLDVPNPDLALKPAMYASVALEIPLGERVVVPTEAVFDQGTRQYLFVAKPEHLYEPREVTLGPRAFADGREVFVIEKGVADGESVVVSGNFLLDSESNQRASAGGAPMAGMPGMPEMKMDEKEMKQEHKH